MNSVIIFDGACNLCNGFVDFVMRRDKKKRFTFLANQSDGGKELLIKSGVEVLDPQTVYLLEEGLLYQQSTAALRILKELSFPWPLLACFLIIPECLRDPVYRFIASRRYKWFGKR